MVSGRDFSIDQASALGESFILNEAAVAEMGLTTEEVIGKRFEMNATGPVIGVVKDFHFAGLQNSLEPLVMTVWPSWFGYISLRLNATNLAQTRTEIEQSWKQVIPNRPFELFFLDDDFERLYQSESQFGQVIVVFAFLAIFISCLGLFGLAVFTAEQRTREVGVRKVLGASVTNIVLLLNKRMSVLVLFSASLAAPLCYVVMHTWLDSFAYHIEISPGVFVLAALGALVIMWLTVAYLSIRAATSDPVNAIRS
jgi:putative ABC transport system permease protein